MEWNGTRRFIKGVATERNDCEQAFRLFEKIAEANLRGEEEKSDAQLQLTMVDKPNGCCRIHMQTINMHCIAFKIVDRILEYSAIISPIHLLQKFWAKVKINHNVRRAPASESISELQEPEPSFDTVGAGSKSEKKYVMNLIS